MNNKLINLLLTAVILIACEKKSYNKSIIVQPNGVDFSWPYVYQLNNDIEKTKKVFILVESNNTGFPSNSYEKIKDRSLEKFEYLSRNLSKLNIVFMQPIFPRIETENIIADFHSLDRNAMILSEPLYKRIDLQLISMIEDLKIKLKRDHGINVEERFLLFGFSASANFAERFSMIHPSKIKGIAIGGVSEYMLPVATWKKELLPYPFGLYDFEEMFHMHFDTESFNTMQRFIFKGSKDDGGSWIEEVAGELVSIPYSEYLNRTYTVKFKKENRTTIFAGKPLSEYDKQLLLYRINGNTFSQIDMFRNTEQVYDSLGMRKAKFKIYEDVAHQCTSKMYSDVTSFFIEVMESPDF